MRALFVLTSPLQYVNALEARHHFQIAAQDAYVALVPSRRHPQSIIQIQNLSAADEWGGRAVLEGVPPLLTVERPKALREWQILQGARKFRAQADAFLEEVGEIDAIFLGDFRARSFRYLGWKRPRAEVYLLDDGSITNQAVRFRNDPRDPALEKRAFPQKKQHQWKLRLAGIPFHAPERMTFFTSYQLRPTRRDEIVAHSFERLARDMQSWQRLDEIWFIGSNHPENGISTTTDYLVLLARIRRFFEATPIRYFAHRGEDPAKLSELGLMGFDVQQSELPLEVVIAERKVYPKVVGAIASSVVDNLAAIFGSRVAILLFLTEPHYYRRQKKHLQEIIRYHRRAAGGNLHAISLVDRRKSLLLDRSEKEPTYSQYRILVEGSASISVYGAQSPDPEQFLLSCQMSGVTHQPSTVKNCEFSSFVVPFVASAPRHFEAPWSTQRSAPVLRSAPRPTSLGRDFWMLFEGTSENLLHQEQEAATCRLVAQGASFRELEAAQSVVTPTGDLDALHLIEDESEGLHLACLPPVTLGVGEAYNVSVYVKRAGRNGVRLSILQGERRRHVDFDLSRGEVVEPAPGADAALLDDLAPRMEATREQWFRIACRLRSQSEAPILAQIQLLHSTQFSPYRRTWQAQYRGDGFSGVYLQNPQLGRGRSVARVVPHSKGRSSLRPGDVLSILPAKQAGTKEGELAAVSIFLNVVHAAEGGEEAPVLCIQSEGAVWLECFLLPDRLRVTGPALGGGDALFHLAPQRAQKVGLSVSAGGAQIALAVGGCPLPLRLQKGLPLVQATTSVQVGSTRADYYHFLVEELRIAWQAHALEDVVQLTR